MKAAADEAERALPSAASLVASPAADELAAMAANAVQPQRVQQRRRGNSSRLLTSSLELEPGLRNHWFPAHFSNVSTQIHVVTAALERKPERALTGKTSSTRLLLEVQSASVRVSTPVARNGADSCLCCVVQKLTADKLIPFELLGEPWVLFRDETGAAACVKDECAHRACPLSLGTVRTLPPS